MRHRKLGRQLATFRHTLTWTFLATIIFLLLMFILNAGIGKDIRASGDPANVVGWFNILFIAWYGIYVAGQFRSRLTLWCIGKFAAFNLNSRKSNHPARLCTPASIRRKAACC